MYGQGMINIRSDLELLEEEIPIKTELSQAPTTGKELQLKNVLCYGTPGKTFKS
jgi:hypothetical protein